MLTGKKDQNFRKHSHSSALLVQSQTEYRKTKSKKKFNRTHFHWIKLKITKILFEIGYIKTDYTWVRDLWLTDSHKSVAFSRFAFASMASNLRFNVSVCACVFVSNKCIKNLTVHCTHTRKKQEERSIFMQQTF